ncbi:hypothetical protein MYX82_11260 [Acidobacteria bacterium AH-259-D05]|nr:hypothetical protein [Acidobacteria bacterium AH-259-D05]
MEIVNVRVRGCGKYPKVAIPSFPLESEEPPKDAMIQEKQVYMEGRFATAGFYLRKKLRPGNRFSGPAIVLEYSSTTFVPPNFKAHIDEWGNIVLEPGEPKP